MSEYRLTQAEKDAEAARLWQKDDDFRNAHPDLFKPKQTREPSMFTPMSYDDYHKNGELVQERESFEEQKARVARMK